MHIVHTALDLCVLVPTTQASFAQGKLPMAPLSEPAEKHWQRGKLPIRFFLSGTGITLAAVVPRFVDVCSSSSYSSCHEIV